MTSPDDQAPAARAMPTQGEPMTAKDRLVGVAIALPFLAFCAAVWLWPDLVGVDTADLTSRNARGFGRLLNMVWSRPVGTIAGVLGLLVLVGSLTNKHTTVLPGEAGDDRE